MYSYKDKTVLITGASSGIGLAIAQELACRGVKLILVARSTEKLNSIAKELQAQGTETHVITSDLSIVGSAKKLYTEVTEADLQVDLLINNAGYGRRGSFTEIERADYASMIQLNITTLTELCHLMIPDMVNRGNGGIINVASTAAFVPIPYGSVYGSTKAYVLTLTEALRYEYRDKGINIMALCPGATESKFMAVATEKSKVKINTDENKGSMSFQTSEEVAHECLKAFAKNKQYIISGRSNRIMYAITRHLPRKMVLNFVGNMFKKVVGK